MLRAQQSEYPTMHLHMMHECLTQLIETSKRKIDKLTKEITQKDLKISQQAKQLNNEKLAKECLKSRLAQLQKKHSGPPADLDAYIETNVGLSKHQSVKELHTPTIEFDQQTIRNISEFMYKFQH